MQQLGEVPIIAEDLGVITPDVVQLRQDIGAPGMAVLQFAWGSGGANTHLPHNHYENCVVYPGAACTMHTPTVEPCSVSWMCSAHV
jgi:4-alpha-glucanotransferase